MKKLKFNSTLEHKSPGYAPYQIEVEKVITLYGREFEKMCIRGGLIENYRLLADRSFSMAQI